MGSMGSMGSNGMPSITHPSMSMSMGMPVGMHARELHDNQGFEGNYLTTFLLIKKYFEKKAPGGRVVSAANWQAWGLEFDSSPSQNFFSAESRVSNNTLLVVLN